jgi:hypothetical protein
MCNLMLFIFYWMGSNLGQERIDVCKQEPSVTETYTSLNYSNKHSVITVLTTSFDIYIILFIFYYLSQQPPVSQGLLIHEVSRSHSTTHHSR